jgi:hypothetical protein
MRTTLLGSSVALLSCALALVAGSAQAQDEAPAEAPPPAAPEAAPPPPAEPAPAEDAPIPAWIRLDSDLFGLQLWAGATHPLGDGIGLASDIYLATSGGDTLGEFDIGPAIAAGPVTVTPMLGFQANWTDRKAQAIVPQLYVTGGPDPLYLEFWFQNYLNSIFTDGAANDIYMRLFVDYKLGKHFGVGPQIEPYLALNDAGATRETGLMSMVIGGNVMLTNYGKGSTMFLFLGYETKESARPDDNGLGGRFTYVYNF